MKSLAQRRSGSARSRPSELLQGNIKKKAARAGLHEADVYELREAFDALDRDHVGYIQPKDLVAAMNSLKLGTWSPTTQHLIDHLLKNTDHVEFDTFLEAIITVLGDKDRQSGVNKIFDFYDPAHTGFISFDNLRRVAQELGEEISDADLADMVMKASSNGSEISREDFYLIFTKRVFP